MRPERAHCLQNLKYFIAHLSTLLYSAALMKDTVILTKDEAERWEKLPAAMRKGWKVEMEKGTRFETEKELEMRHYMLNVDGRPGLKSMLKKIREGKAEKVQPDEIPADIAEEFFFTIGAAGITVLMRILLLEAKNEKDIGSLVLLSHMRSSILRANADISH